MCEQEVPDRVGLAAEHLLHEVVDDVAVVPGEAGDEAGGVVAPLEREGGQLERGDPPLGAALQGGDVGGVEVQADDVVEVRADLGRREAEVGGADLDQLAARTQPGQRQCGVGAAC